MNSEPGFGTSITAAIAAEAIVVIVIFLIAATILPALGIVS